jgi:hypothetical protein
MGWHGTGTMHHHLCFVLSSTKPIKTLQTSFLTKETYGLTSIEPIFTQLVLSNLYLNLFIFLFFVVGTTSLSVFR